MVFLSLNSEVLSIFQLFNVLTSCYDVTKHNLPVCADRFARRLIIFVTVDSRSLSSILDAIMETMQLLLIYTIYIFKFYVLHFI